MKNIIKYTSFLIALTSVAPAIAASDAGATADKAAGKEAGAKKV